MSKNRFVSIAATLLTSILVCASTAPSALASESAVPIDDSVVVETMSYAEMRAEMNRAGIPLATQDSLIKKLNAGQLWDSMIGSKPISTVQRESRAGIEEVQRFADGSVIITTIEKPTASSIGGIGILSRPVTGCAVLPNLNGWIRRADCNAKAKYMSYSLSFKIDYSVKAGRGRVDAVNSAKVTALPPWTVNEKSLTIPRAISSGTVPARARLDATLAFVKYAGSFPAWLEVKVLTSAYVEDGT